MDLPSPCRLQTFLVGGCCFQCSRACCHCSHGTAPFPVPLPHGIAREDEPAHLEQANGGQILCILPGNRYEVLHRLVGERIEGGEWNSISTVILGSGSAGLSTGVFQREDMDSAHLTATKESTGIPWQCLKRGRKESVKSCVPEETKMRIQKAHRCSRKIHYGIAAESRDEKDRLRLMGEGHLLTPQADLPPDPELPPIAGHDGFALDHIDLNLQSLPRHLDPRLLLPVFRLQEAVCGHVKGGPAVISHVMPPDRLVYELGLYPLRLGFLNPCVHRSLYQREDGPQNFANVFSATRNVDNLLSRETDGHWKEMRCVLAELLESLVAEGSYLRTADGLLVELGNELSHLLLEESHISLSAHSTDCNWGVLRQFLKQ